jgi:hypothetical protein
LAGDISLEEQIQFQSPIKGAARNSATRVHIAALRIRGGTIGENTHDIITETATRWTTDQYVGPQDEKAGCPPEVPGPLSACAC